MPSSLPALSYSVLRRTLSSCRSSSAQGTSSGCTGSRCTSGRPRTPKLASIHRPAAAAHPPCLPWVQVDHYHGRPQLVAKVGPSSFCLFDGRQDGSRQPYQRSSSSFHFDGREEGLLCALRTYMATLNRQALRSSSTYLRRIHDVRPGEYFDVVCRVLAVDDSQPDFRVVHLWDGSDALPFPLA